MKEVTYRVGMVLLAISLVAAAAWFLYSLYALGAH